jgi:hypothetical protein
MSTEQVTRLYKRTLLTLFSNDKGIQETFLYPNELFNLAEGSRFEIERVDGKKSYVVTKTIPKYSLVHVSNSVGEIIQTLSVNYLLTEQ